jgi:hypothetical protein
MTNVSAANSGVVTRARTKTAAKRLIFMNSPVD